MVSKSLASLKMPWTKTTLRWAVAGVKAKVSIAMESAAVKDGPNRPWRWESGTRNMMVDTAHWREFLLPCAPVSRPWNLRGGGGH